MENKRIGACILAAGYSSRMGEFKPLLPIGDETVIERVIGVARAAGIADIVVVSGHGRERLAPILKDREIREVVNPDFAAGMFTSIQAGLRALPEGLDGVFLLPVDCPLVSTRVLEKLRKAFTKGSDCFYVPCYRGKKGHPLLAPSAYFEEIVNYGGPGGLKGITDRDYSKMIRIETGDESVLLDMDTKEDYEVVRRYLAGGCKSDDLLELAAGRRFFLVRHGQTQQHAGKIFLGQADIPLSERGKLQAEDAGREIAGLRPETERIYSSDLKRARETAETIQRATGFRHLILEDGLREMALGPWDGKLIREVKEKFPEEYQKRGEHLFAYKLGHGSENFYDLQYRVYKTMVRILKEDTGRDLVIVSHSGVLRALCNNLSGKDISQCWEKVENGQVRIIEVTK